MVYKGEINIKEARDWLPNQIVAVAEINKKCVPSLLDVFTNVITSNWVNDIVV